MQNRVHPNLVNIVIIHTNPAVMRLNGPGNKAANLRNGQLSELKTGDVVIIPSGTGHEFTHIEDHINYLMVRVDPDKRADPNKIVPLMDKQASEAHLKKREN